MSTQDTKEWLTEFNHRFVKLGKLYGNNLEVKDFITDLLSQARKEGQEDGSRGDYGRKMFQRGYTEGIREVLEVLPKEKIEDMDGRVPRYRDGVDMWGEEYGEKFNDRIFQFNSALTQSREAIEKLLTKQ